MLASKNLENTARRLSSQVLVTLGVAHVAGASEKFWGPPTQNVYELSLLDANPST
jgi:hypothetical protein